jgi:ribonuclease BN (tRNA processing enzyme)
MPVQLTVIGCSPAWPNPGGTHAGYLVESPGRLLLDCGPGVLAQLRRREPWPRPDAILITHFHLDHCGDLVPWVFGSIFGQRPSPPRVQLWVPPDGAAELHHLVGALGAGELLDQVFEVHEYPEGKPFRVAGFELLALRVPHYGEATFGVRVSDGSRTLAYSSDSGPSERLVEIARDADLFLCEATLDEPEPDPEHRGHLTAAEAVETSERAGARRLLVIHRPEELPLPDGVERAHDGWSETL